MISIIMPVKNAANFLEECLNSILHQTEKNWELIAVDDHSSDASSTILNKFEGIDPSRIHVFDNEGSGIIDALNFGYKNALGEFITRMDADDVMPPKKLEILKSKLLKKGPGHLSTGKVKYISETQLGDGYRKYEIWLNALCDSDKHYEEIYRECVIPSPCWMMFKTDFERIGGFYAKSYPEDYDLCFRMYKRHIKVVPSTQLLHIWRDHGERTSRNDDNYADNRFLEMKVQYFLELDLEKKKQLNLWGAGKKGKRIAQLLTNQNIEFNWISNNLKKIGKDIYRKVIIEKDSVNRESPSSNIIAIANPNEQAEVLKFIKTNLPNSKTYPFC